MLQQSIVISDTSCLIALSNIGLLKILKDLFQEVYITNEVKEEFGQKVPDWIITIDVENTELKKEITRNLDPGEASSIALAIELANSLLVIDELKGRKVAKSYQIKIIGTLGILVLAYKKGYLIDLAGAIQKLVNSGFRLSNHILEKLKNKPLDE